MPKVHHVVKLNVDQKPKKKVGTDYALLEVGDPGVNTPEDVRAAQRLMLACAISQGTAGQSDEGVVYAEQEVLDVLSMVTQEETYVQTFIPPKGY
jgi:hypothetical protein